MNPQGAQAERGTVELLFCLSEQCCIASQQDLETVKKGGDFCFKSKQFLRGSCIYCFKKFQLVIRPLRVDYFHWFERFMMHKKTMFRRASRGPG